MAKQLFFDFFADDHGIGPIQCRSHIPLDSMVRKDLEERGIRFYTATLVNFFIAHA